MREEHVVDSGQTVATALEVRSGSGGGKAGTAVDKSTKDFAPTAHLLEYTSAADRDRKVDALPLKPLSRTLKPKRLAAPRGARKIHYDEADIWIRRLTKRIAASAFSRTPWPASSGATARSAPAGIRPVMILQRTFVD